jgi:DNA uptake protein ComE-like DNA-binding protein
MLRMAILCLPLACVSMLSYAQTGSRTHEAPPPELRVDINHATVEELLKVPGMTRSWAGRIVRFRPYRTKADLLELGVVDSEVYNRIRDFVIAHHEKQ